MATPDSGSLRLGNGAEDGLHSHPMAEVRIDESCPDAAVRPDHQHRRDRQQPASISLKLREIDAEGRRP